MFRRRGERRSGWEYRVILRPDRVTGRGRLSQAAADNANGDFPPIHATFCAPDTRKKGVFRPAVQAVTRLAGRVDNVESTL
jgi:hypothetical protein